MFETLTERLSTSLRSISGTGQLTEDNIKDTLREVRMALLEADVALPVTRDFVSRVKDKGIPCHNVNNHYSATIFLFWRYSLKTLLPRSAHWLPGDGI